MLKQVKKTNQMLKELLFKLLKDPQQFSENIYSEQKSADQMDDKFKKYKSSLERDFYFTRSSYPAQGNFNKKDTKVNSTANLFSSEGNDDYAIINKDADESKLPEIYEKCLKSMLKNFQLEAKRFSNSSDEEDIEL